jgi:hypothetical protein
MGGRSDNSIQVTEDLAFQIRMSRFQRIALWFFPLLLAGALAGLAGGGPLSRTMVQDAAGVLRLRFDRFARSTAPQTLELKICSEEAGHAFELSMDAEFLRRVQIESITPQPIEQSGFADGIRLSINVNPPGHCALILIRYRPIAAGWLHGRLRVEQSNVSFDQFVYP